MISTQLSALRGNLLTSVTAALVALQAVGCARPGPLRLGVVITPVGVAAARLAVEAVNREGGIDGRRLELAVVNEAFEDSMPTVVAHAQRLAADPRVLGVVGHANSTASLTASVVYNLQGVLQIAPTTTAALFGRAGRYSFSMVPDDRRQPRFLAACAHLGPTDRVALIYSNDDYGRGLATGLRQELAQQGSPAVFDAPYLALVNVEDLLVMSRSLVLAHPSVLLWVGGATELGAVLPGLRRRLPQLHVYATDTFDAPDAYENAGGALTGVRFVRFFDPQSPDPRIRRLRRDFRARTGGELTNEAVMVYDAVGLLAAGLRSGARTRDALREYLLSVGNGRPPYPGVAGAVEFRAGAMAERAYRLAEVTRDGVRSLDEPAAAGTAIR